MALWASIMPIDVAKTRIQTATGADAGMGIMRTLRALYHEGNRWLLLLPPLPLPLLLLLLLPPPLPLLL